jgi:hypothetical protein
VRLKMMAVLFALSIASVHAQTLTFDVDTVNAVERVTPKLTWSTSPAATSCTASGAWSGTKAANGTETLAEITSSQVYTLTCSWPAQLGASIDWKAPTENTDGTALVPCLSDTPTDKKCLLKYRLFYGKSPGALTTPKDISRNVIHWDLPGLSGGTWYFQLKAVNAAGVESAGSQVLSKVTGEAGGTMTTSRGITIDPRPNDPPFTVK